MIAIRNLSTGLISNREVDCSQMQTDFIYHPIHVANKYGVNTEIPSLKLGISVSSWKSNFTQVLVQ